jgi:phosphopantothenoylcysteine decarboxylase / phosphopantothenate---cysteine ligase
MSLYKKNIVLAVSGSIAAYKSAELVRLLVKQGAQVKVIMTQSASRFITPLTLQTLSNRSVSTELLDSDEESTMGHIDIARWADLVLLAPATANRLAHLAHGFCEDIVDAVCLATTAPIAVAPSMNQQMWKNVITQTNVRQLVSHGFICWGPDEGEQACGEVGAGRMVEPEVLLKNVEQQFCQQSLVGLRVMITAGPTQEAIDPVRFISNHSSGKMGYALAAEARKLGAEVVLISGPVSIKTPDNVDVVLIQSAQQMYDSVRQQIGVMDIFIGCAAVSDYRIDHVAKQKIKKSSEQMVLNLQPTEDILKMVAANYEKMFAVGFAAETNDVDNNALKKLHDKKLDMIIANRVGSTEKGFSADKNEVTVFAENFKHHIALADKSHVARDIMQIIVNRYIINSSKTGVCADGNE